VTVQGLITYLIIGTFIGVILMYVRYRYKIYAKTSEFRQPDREFPYQWRNILQDKVDFYKRLKPNEKRLFERKVHVFLLNVRIVGMQTEVTHDDRILIAAGAVIPVFRFKNWHYRGLKEVLLYPDKFQIPTTDKYANGLVGWGEMEGRMMLSRKALHHGFADLTDGKNVAVHEFLHLFDKADGEVDGVLGNVMRENDIGPWLFLIQSKMHEINLGDSDIREYGGVNEAEFLAVVGEYFFEKPGEMREEHPALYNALDSFFNPPKELIEKFKYTSKYDKCPCGSGKRFGDCCMKNMAEY
jgi:Mlc titration factor MtfA (ptsG expression regulator)